MMLFKNGNTTFSFTMRVTENNAKTVDNSIYSHGKWILETYLTEPENGKLQTLKYFVSKATELKDMMVPSRVFTGNIIYNRSEVHLNESILVNIWNLGKAGIASEIFSNCLKNTFH